MSELKNIAMSTTTTDNGDHQYFIIKTFVDGSTELDSYTNESTRDNDYAALAKTLSQGITV